MIKYLWRLISTNWYFVRCYSLFMSEGMIYIRISSKIFLYCLRDLIRLGHNVSLHFRITRISQINRCLSETHAEMNPPRARKRMKILKSSDIFVNCMKLASQAAGSSSMYTQNSKSAIIVTTKGTALKSAAVSRKENS